MPLPTPNLDDRRFQDILDEARRRIPELCPQWTDHNLSDPGITLLELFAWMTDLILYRLNRVPDKTYIKFLELIGVQMQPARASTTELLVRLTAPQFEETVIPRGTAIATEGMSDESAVTFTTDRDLVINVPRLIHLIACYGDRNYNDYMPELKKDDRPGVFSQRPQPGDRLYFGFSNDLSGHTLVLQLDCPVKGISVNPY